MSEHTHTEQSDTLAARYEELRHAAQEAVDARDWAIRYDHGEPDRPIMTMIRLSSVLKGHARGGTRSSSHSDSLPTQAQTLEWVRERWPDRTDPAWRALKLGEEAGEVQGAVVKMAEGRKNLTDLAQETAQLVICAMALAESAGFDLRTAVALEWRERR